MVRPVLEEEKGLKILCEPAAATDTASTIDIVAIHGIGAHPDDTWTAKDERDGHYINWLTDERMLPRVVPYARIMRYGYESQWFGKEAMNVQVADIADRLLKQLRRKRKEYPYRPLIFICHCFGGLVVLEALNRAHSDEEEWPGTYKSTAGLAFFGTPFRGAGGLSQTDMVVAALTQYRVDEVQGDTLRVLQAGDPHLRSITDAFGRLQSKANKIPAACFYETKSSDVGGIVGGGERYSYAVDRDSGCLDLAEGVSKHSLSRTHFDMNKFKSPTEEDYEMVEEELKKLADGAHTRVAARAQRHSRSPDNECLRALRLTDPRDDKREILAWKGPPLKDSCLWVRDDPAFVRWWTNDDSRILWIHGDPGKGKTMIMMSLAEEISSRIRAASQTPALSYFFCQSTNSSTNTATSVIRGLIYMLVKEQPRLLGHLQKKYDDAGPGLFEGSSTLYSLWSILSDIVNDPSLGTVYLMIDALDECNAELMSLLELVTRRELSAMGNVKWLLTSRNESSIKRKLEYGDGRQHTSLEVNAAHVSGVVESFINFKVEELARQNEYEQELRDFVLGYLRENAQGTFLWVALVCREIAEAQLWEVESLLRSFPAGLEPFYYRMMKQVGDLSGSKRDYCLRVLRATTVASRPLMLEELLFVAGLSDGLVLGIKAVRQMVELCGSFLTVRESVVYFVHQSAKDYCDTGPGSQILGYGSGSWQAGAHGDLARRSLELMTGKLKQDMCDLQAPGSLAKEVEKSVVEARIGVDLRYACLNWIDHLMKCDERASEYVILLDNGPIHSFFRHYLLYWFESLSLLGEISKAVTGLLELDSNLQKNSSTTGLELQAAISDAKRFLFSCRSAIEIAPLQIYSSALLFSPTRSVTRRNYEALMPCWIAGVPQVEETWGALVHTLEGHSHWVSSVVFSRDGKLLASGSRDSTVRIWDAATGASVHTLEGHSNSVTSVVFSRDGKLLASGSGDRTVRIWDAATGASVHTLEGHSNSVASVVFSRDGKLLASGSGDRTVRIWDAATGASVHTLEGHSDWVSSVVFSRDGKLLASGSYDRTVRIWDAATGASVHTLEGHSDWVSSVVFSRDGKLLASGSRDSTVRIWDAATGASVHTLEGHSNSVTSVVFSRDGKLLASGSYDRTVRIWDAATGASVHTLEGHLSSVNSVVFSRDGKLLASGSRDSTVRIWDAATGASVHTLEGHSDWVSSVVFSRDGKLLASGSGDRTVRIWDAATGASVHTLEGHSNSVASVVFSRDGKLLASGSGDRTVRIWDAATGASVHTLEGHSDWVSSVVFSRDGKLLASGSRDSTVRIWDAATGASVHTLEGHSDWVSSVVFSRDGKLLASGSGDRTVRIWDAATGASVHTLEGHSDWVSSVVFSRDGKLLASGSRDSTVRIWDAATGASVHTLEGHSDWVSSVVFSRDGKLLASGSSDRTVRIWDAATGASVHTLEGHSHWVASVVFSRDGKLLASGSGDRTVRIWDAATGASVHTLEGHSNSVASVVFSRDGKLLASGSDESTVRIWDSESGSCVRCIHGVFDSRSMSLDETVLHHEPAWNNTAPSAPQIEATGFPSEQSSSLFEVSSDVKWITRDGKRMLWLPSHVRPISYAIRGSAIMLGSGAGRMTLLFMR